MKTTVSILQNPIIAHSCSSCQARKRQQLLNKGSMPAGLQQNVVLDSSFSTRGEKQERGGCLRDDRAFKKHEVMVVVFLTINPASESCFHRKASSYAPVWPALFEKEASEIIVSDMLCSNSPHNHHTQLEGTMLTAVSQCASIFHIGSFPYPGTAFKKWSHLACSLKWYYRPRRNLPCDFAGLRAWFQACFLLLQK